VYRIAVFLKRQQRDQLVCVRGGRTPDEWS